MLSSSGKTVITVAAIVVAAIVIGLVVLLLGPEGDDIAVASPEETIEEEPAGWRPIDGQYAVSSAHERATEAGLAVLEAGGTAADAAVAVAGALTILEPWFSSVLGGGTWALYYDAQRDEVTSLDGVGPAPQAVTVESMAERGAGERGMHQANMPGAWDGWMLWLERYGRLELGEVLEPAIRAAEEGYAASPRLIQWLGINRASHFEQEAFAHGEQMYADIEDEGDTVYQHEQADTFRRILSAYEAARDDGRSAAIQAARDFVYRGPIAESIVAYSEEHDGFLALEDFRDFEAQIVEPISVDYNGLTIYQNPPNSQGITQLILLKILEGFDFDQYEMDDADAVHLQVEATKLAFADRHHHVGDPDFVDVPVEALLSDEHIDARRAQISMDEVLEWPIEPLLETAAGSRPAGDHTATASRGTAPLDRNADGGTLADSALGGTHAGGAPAGATHAGGAPADGTLAEGAPAADSHSTTTFHIIDPEGNAAAVTTSIGAQFLVIPDTGIHINSRMTMMHRDHDNPNVIEPGKKVRHTSNPYMVFAGEAPYILGGNTGGDTQPQAQAQQFIAFHEFGATPEEAVSRPRFLSRGFPGVSYPHSVGNDIRFEDGFDEQVIAELEERGHQIYDGGTGGLEGSAYMLVVDPESGEIGYGADPRDGVGTGEVRRIMPESK